MSDSIAKLVDIFVADVGVFQVLGTRQELLEKWKAALAITSLDKYMEFTAVGLAGNSNPVTFHAGDVRGIGGEHEYEGPLSMSLIHLEDAIDEADRSVARAGIE